MHRAVIGTILAFTVAACGGGGTNTVGISATSARVFPDGSGVGILKYSNGTVAYALAPEIAASVAATNIDNSVVVLDTSDFSIISRKQGYTIRQGADGAVNALVAENDSTGANSMVYVFDNTGDALLVATTPTASLPSGIHTYRGIYGVGDRRYGGADLGEATVAVDFTRGEFAISAISARTSLNGDGFLEVANGNLSGSELVFVDSVYGTYSASIVGKVGTTAGTDEAVGVWYTNDVNPDFGGGFATKK
jgi:hypothetical protein